MLNSTGLVSVDVAGNSAIHCLVGAQSCTNNSQIGLGTAYEKMHIGIGAAKIFLDFAASIVAIGVQTIAISLVHISSSQAL